MESVREDLFQFEYYILGDSAYPIELLLLPPYDASSPKTSEDDFNFSIKCKDYSRMCFWRNRSSMGIFWKILSCSLDHTSVIIEGEMRLHSFLVDYRDEYCDKEKEANERRIFTEDMENSGSMIMVVGNDVGITGRISNQKKNDRHRGMQLKDKLRIFLMKHDMHRARNEE